jgi:hypothetical protein
MFFVSAWTATAMLLVEAPFAFRAAVLAMTVATLGVVQEFVMRFARRGTTTPLTKTTTDLRIAPSEHCSGEKV